MRQVYLKNAGSRSLVLFFGGWGSGPELFSGMDVPENHDFMLCYDYRSLDFDISGLGRYASIKLAAWSMGVWVAGKVFSSGDTSFAGILPLVDSRIAICGTPFPIDDEMGIPESVFAGTLSGMSETVLAKFRRRMCGKSLASFLSRLPDRPVEELGEELSCLWNHVKSSGRMSAAGFKWDYALCGTRDLIFPFRNQLEAWGSLDAAPEIIRCDSAHYDEELFAAVIGGRITE